MVWLHKFLMARDIASRGGGRKGFVAGSSDYTTPFSQRFNSLLSANLWSEPGTDRRLLLLPSYFVQEYARSYGYVERLNMTLHRNNDRLVTNREQLGMHPVSFTAQQE